MQMTLTVGIVDDDIRIKLGVVDDPKAPGAVSDDLAMEHWTPQIAVSQKTESEKKDMPPIWRRRPFLHWRGSWRMRIERNE